MESTFPQIGRHHAGIGGSVEPIRTGLEDVGNNYLRETANTGTRTLGGGTTNGAGDVIGGALEGSNVSLEEEFVSMIQAQRSYQANAGTIRAADQTLQELVNLF